MSWSWPWSSRNPRKSRAKTQGPRNRSFLDPLDAPSDEFRPSCDTPRLIVESFPMRQYFGLPFR